MNRAYELLQQQRRDEEQAAEIEETVRLIWADCFLPEWPEELTVDEQPTEETE
jgi:hypothetical protein